LVLALGDEDKLAKATPSNLWFLVLPKLETMYTSLIAWTDAVYPTPVSSTDTLFSPATALPVKLPQTTWLAVLLAVG
jgi:hypothetical protein